MLVTARKTPHMQQLKDKFPTKQYCSLWRTEVSVVHMEGKRKEHRKLRHAAAPNALHAIDKCLQIRKPSCRLAATVRQMYGLIRLTYCGRKAGRVQNTPAIG